MAQTLPRDAVEERLRWLEPHLDGKRSLKDIAEISPFSYRTLKRWAALYRNNGMTGLLPQSRKPHHHPKEYSEQMKEKIRQIRLETNLGPDVLTILLKREGIKISHSGIGKFLKREGLSKSRKRLAKKNKWQPKLTLPGELIEIDVVYARKFKGKWLYQFTAIDSATRWRYIAVYPSQGNAEAINFLERTIKAAPFRIRGVKTDNASIFTNRYTGYPKSADPAKPRLHVFDRACERHNIAHYLIDGGKPQQNGKVERSHRTDRERFWNKIAFSSIKEARQKQKSYLKWYNEICPHLGLEGMTPVEKLKSYQGTNVRV